MEILRFFASLLIVAVCFPVLADCEQECDTTYNECKAAHDSPNGTKVCGSDYNECKSQCAENGK